MSVAARSQKHAPFPFGSFVRASSLHVGAAAAAAALRRDLVDQEKLSAAAFDEAYAVARVTPGTNLLAMYTLLGERIAGWKGRSDCSRCWYSSSRADRRRLGCSAKSPTRATRSLKRPCKVPAAGALAVFVWAIVTLARPQFEQHRRRGVALAVGTLALTLLLPIPQFVILLVAGGLGAAFLTVEP